MAHESFEDDEVAQLLNARFLAVKVDREERPDVDAVYMEAVQLVNGSGGWPMTVLALPDGRPFLGRHLPAQSSLRPALAPGGGAMGRAPPVPGRRRRTAVRGCAQRRPAPRRAPTAGPALPEALDVPGPATIDDLAWPGALTGPDGSEDALARAARALMARSDPEWGGSGTAPVPPARVARRAGPVLLALGRTHCPEHAAPGARRHELGRYLRPPGRRFRPLQHRPLLARPPLRKDALRQRSAGTGLYPGHGSLREGSATARWWRRPSGTYWRPPVRLSAGAWASAEDADSEGEEGRFYVWSRQEVERVGGAAVADWYGVTTAGNWEGKNVLWRPGLGELGRPADIEEARARLLEHRQARPRPGLDAKVVTEWNAMAISALAYAGTALDRPSWVAAATETADVLLGQLRGTDGRWRRSWLPGMALSKHLACSADYAWLVEAFTRLSEATGEARWVSEARAAADTLIELFWDHGGGGFYTTGKDGEH